MYLYRIISGAEWSQTKVDGKVPRCASDKRDMCIHLTRFEDIVTVADKYFTIDEKPVALEIDIRNLEDKIVWKEPTVQKPWIQPEADIDAIEWKIIKGYASLLPSSVDKNSFSLSEFQEP